MKVKLGDVCIIQSGGTPSRSNLDYWKNGTISWVKISDIKDKYLNFTEEYITYEGLKNSSAKIFSKGTILYTIFATLGEVSILNIEAATNQAIAGIKLVDENVYNDFLYYYLVSKKEEVNNRGRGVAQNNINLSMLKNIEIEMPNIEKQRKIANVLDKVNKIINKRQQQLKKLDELVKSRFIEMFGTFPENSKNWTICTIKEIVSDVRYGTSRAAVDGGKYPYLRMNNITYDGELDLTDLKYIDIPDKELEKCTVKCGDVLFNRTNSKELVGKTCVYNRNDTMVLAGFIIRIRVNENILPVFLAMFLNMDFSKTMLKEMCKSAIGQANINATELQKIRIILPPIELQEEFVEFKNQTDKSKLEIQKSLDKLEILKKSLMQQYFG